MKDMMEMLDKLHMIRDARRDLLRDCHSKYINKKWGPKMTFADGEIAVAISELSRAIGQKVYADYKGNGEDVPYDETNEDLGEASLLSKEG
jgi:hypothetical protein